MYLNGETIGTWRTQGNVYLITANDDGIGISRATEPSGSYPVGLVYYCMLRITGLEYNNGIPASYTTFVEIIFVNVKGGMTYKVSFWSALRPNYGTPEVFNVILGGLVVYSTIPLNYPWTYLTTASISATSASLTLRFEMSSTDTVDRDMAIDTITLIQLGSVSPTYSPTPKSSLSPTIISTSTSCVGGFYSSKDTCTPCPGGTRD